MKTDSPLIVLLLWLIALVISSLLLHSCSPCNLKEEYTVSINDARVIAMHSSLHKAQIFSNDLSIGHQNARHF